METIAPPARFVDRRRPYPVAPRGVDFVERRRPTPVLLRDVYDLHDADLDDVVADGLAEGSAAVPAETSRAIAEAVAVARLVGRSGPAALLAHDLAV